MEQSQPPPPPPFSGGRHHSYLDVIDQPSPQLGRRLHGLEADDFLSVGRTTKMRQGCFALVNTVVGGGTLSLSYSFHKAGAVLGTILLALICLGTDMTLFCLISASRRTGAKSYEVRDVDDCVLKVSRPGRIHLTDPPTPSQTPCKW